MFILGSGIKCLGSNVHFGVGDQMSILVSGIKSLGIKCPGIKCPFLGWGSKVRGSNVHFGLGDQKSGDQMSGDQMSSGLNVHFGSGIESLWDQKTGDQNSEIKSLGIRSPGIKCPSPPALASNVEPWMTTLRNGAQVNFASSNEN